MIDLHSHILPGLDDGCKTLKQAIEMARIYVSTGFHTVVATPHYVLGTAWSPSPQTLLKRVNEINKAVSDQGIKLHVMAGMEIGMDPAIADLLCQKKMIPLGASSYVLVEVPFQQFPLGFEQILFDIISNGYLVILAHPERCEQLIREPDLFHKLQNIGCLVQVDWASLLGHHGLKSARLTKKLLISGYVHCLATDSHDLQYRSPEIVKKGIERLIKIVGEEQARILTIENPVRILRSKTFNPFKQEKAIKKEGIINRLFSWG